MALLSPGIQIFESSVTPAAATAPAENGVATLGFSTKGPINELIRIRSVSEFAEVFGDPIEDFPYAHIMAQSVLANGTDVYFMRLADQTKAKAAKCPVISSFSVEPAEVALKADVTSGSVPIQNGAISMLWNSETTDTPVHDLTYRIELSHPTLAEDPVLIECEASFYSDTTLGAKGIVSFGINTDFINAFNASEAKKYFDYIIVNEEGKSEVGVILKALNARNFDSESKTLTLNASLGYYDTNNTWYYLSGSSIGTPWRGQAVSTETITHAAGSVTTDDFGGKAMRANSTLKDFTLSEGDDQLENYSRFNLVASNPGSSMNGVIVTKTTVKSSVGGDETWTVSVYEKDAQQPYETRTGITPENFLSEMTKFATIAIEDAELRNGKTAWEWVDGRWELGTGLVLDDGTSWQPSDNNYIGDIYVAEEGTDGFPAIGNQYNESKAVELYVNALGKDEFVNTDEYSFSILATPGMQATLVQNAAINVCATRGDAIYLADIPLQYCKNKQSIDDVVAWANGNSGFQSSYCAIYYGWFAQTNPYDKDGNSIMCPASCFIAPKMVALDTSMGEFYAPAGITRGNLICSDWSYSPDQKDRDKLVGNDNVVNPISYSNTRGVTIMSQKTTDRTTSPLNRVGIRRMTNAIKRNLRSQLVALLFEPNNETARARARGIADNIMASLRSRECIESYDINVVSGTGAARNELNVYLSFAPYGLIEKIYVYLSITDAGVEVTETVA